MSDHPPPSPSSTGRANVAWMVFAAVAAFYLWTEHRAHLLGLLPYVLLLACPLMHFFMHGRHRHRHTPPPGESRDRRRESR